MELNREQIIKALECCKSFRDFYMCDICPYYRLELADDENCTNRLSQDALALIKELTEENERLKNICESYMLQYGTAVDKNVLIKSLGIDLK